MYGTAASQLLSAHADRRVARNLLACLRTGGGPGCACTSWWRGFAGRVRGVAAAIAEVHMRASVRVCNNKDQVPGWCDGLRATDLHKASTTKVDVTILATADASLLMPCSPGLRSLRLPTSCMAVRRASLSPMPAAPQLQGGLSLRWGSAPISPIHGVPHSPFTLRYLQRDTLCRYGVLVAALSTST